jgi:hypothetical protein
MPKAHANIEKLSTKQFGDACEYAALAELGFAGHAAMKMPDANRNYDLLIATQRPCRISVRGLRAGRKADGGRKLAGYWNFDPNKFDWLVLMRVNIETGERHSFVLPQKTAKTISKLHGKWRMISFRSPELAKWKDNFALEEHPSPPKSRRPSAHT